MREKILNFFGIQEAPLQTNMTAIDYKERGDGFSDHGLFDEAITDFSNSIILKPDYVQAYNNRAINYAAKKMFKEAIDDFNVAISLIPSSPELFLNRGIVHKAQNKLDNALSDYTRAIGLNPQLMVAYFSRGMIFYLKEMLTEAIADFSKAVELNPNYTEAYNKRGLAYWQQALPGKEIIDLLNAKNLQPAYIIVELFNRSLNNSMLDFTSAIQLKPDYAEAYHNRAIIFETQGYFPEAISDFLKAIELNRQYIKDIHLIRKILKHYQDNHNDDVIAKLVQLHHNNKLFMRFIHELSILPANIPLTRKTISDHADIQNSHVNILIELNKKQDIFSLPSLVNQSACAYNELLPKQITLEPIYLGSQNEIEEYYLRKLSM